MTAVSKLRDKILAAEDIESEVVPVPQWDAKIEVRALDGRARARFFTQYINPETGDMDYERMYPSLLIQTCFDPETGEKVFTDDDHDALNAKSGAALETVAKVALRLSGLGKDAVKEAGKDSSSSQRGGSSSS